MQGARAGVGVPTHTTHVYIERDNMNNEYLKLMLTLMVKMLDTAPNTQVDSVQKAETVAPINGGAAPVAPQPVTPQPQAVQTPVYYTQPQPQPQPQPQVVQTPVYYPQMPQPQGSSELDEIKKMIQMLNINSTGMTTVPQQETSADVIANIIAPPLPEYGAEPNGGKIRNG